MAAGGKEEGLFILLVCIRTSFPALTCPENNPELSENLTSVFTCKVSLRESSGYPFLIIFLLNILFNTLLNIPFLLPEEAHLHGLYISVVLIEIFKIHGLSGFCKFLWISKCEQE